MRLIDADELKKDLSRFYGGEVTAKQLIDEQPTIYSWISVKDRLPGKTMATFHVIDKRTGKEADPYEIALKEDWAKDLCYCDMEGFAIEEDGTLLLLDECGRHEYCDPDRFEVVWDAAD